ncbi:putative pectinesterase 63 [Phalaenopsis equestris]|uniref:putative pectinesterase 63 n=1 Tax=Phalaenopsis equestris TaxID=78828 RepID=UPI0009E2505F|nr:putative pectinesterase 63 [Phalaenopsis equestris]
MKSMIATKAKNTDSFVSSTSPLPLLTNHLNMSEPPANFINSPASMAIFAALFLLPIISPTAVGSILHPNSAVFDQRISDSPNGFQSRGINAGLDAKLHLAEKHPRFIAVRKDGKGDFKTISDAIDSIPQKNRQRVVIRIGPGVYREKVKIERTKPFVTFSGDPKAMPTITFAGTAAEYGTLDSASVIVESHYFVASNIIFENSAPAPVLGVKGAQAVALRISGDKAAFYRCKFLGYQDTLCDDKGRHFFKDCFIQGTVDFIFGNARSIYLNCVINSVANGITYITAQARSKIADKSGFAFVHCKVTGTGSAFLSRAWKESSRVVFAYTYMDSVVNPRGWDDRGFKERQGTVFYGEYKCSGPGASTSKRVSYAKLLTDKQAKPFLSMTFIRGKTWILPRPQL